MERGPEAEIRTRIAEHGAITFAEFMEVALYHPDGGYYTQARHEADHGDYFTSPSAHPAFSALIAIHLEAMWETLGCPDPFHVVEMGAGTGLMAHDIFEHVRQNMPSFAEDAQYVSMDLYPQRASFSEVGEKYPAGVVGCVLSNELVDAFPVHRFEIREGTLAEIFVKLGEDGGLVSVVGEPSTPELARRLDDLGISLPDGARGEINLQIGPWMKRVVDILSKGFVLTIDYGHVAAELYAPERSKGTLQTYYKHTSGSSPYQWVGSQDITAHVDFTTVMNQGRALGLNSLGLLTQVEYLNRLGIGRWMEKLQDTKISPRERDANAMAMRELVKPDGLGGFKVLVQEKGTRLADVGATWPSLKRIDDLPVPLLRDDHVPLLEGKYPQTTWEVENLWPLEQ
jgi:SAM-dependent MidA family methyltransferase